MGAGHPRLAPQFFSSMKAILKVSYGNMKLIANTNTKKLISIIILPFQKLFVLL
jgi:hypothetical protein